MHETTSYSLVNKHTHPDARGAAVGAGAAVSGATGGGVGAGVVAGLAHRTQIASPHSNPPHPYAPAHLSPVTLLLPPALCPKSRGFGGILYVTLHRYQIKNI